jgi:hypothetical protein
MSEQWLPALILMRDFGGDWKAYMEALYCAFAEDFLTSPPQWVGKKVGLKRHPISQGKEATFWHFISEGKIEAERTPDLRRCERIRWPRPTMEAFTDQRPVTEAPVVWWKNERRGEERRERRGDQRRDDTWRGEKRIPTQGRGQDHGKGTTIRERNRNKKQINGYSAVLLQLVSGQRPQSVDGRREPEEADSRG